ncbi:GNAT family N-acetyltransferase [Acetobacter sp. DsW_063]|uniref:GNAT family N-acetyltransferase n=1 Tax=Acetobacter sp. DsW_063 TaxID=1514894 RepID=UPI000A3B85F1|nr:GNAT family N-acetyltransferase [Acetobacter sp. DsW_063]OUJ14554.1 acetyltransferase [Acetobacter sp. DsW_063]
MTLHFLPATMEIRQDVETVFDDCSDGRGCYCAYWYRSNALYKAGWQGGNKGWFPDILDQKRPRGLVAYSDNDPAGWCGVAAREVYDRLRRSKSFAPVDERPVWSVTCFIVRKRYRRHGVAGQLLDQAITFARAQGATCLEAYPLDLAVTTDKSDLFVGALSMFLDRGFVEVARRLPARPIVRLDL